MSCTPSSCKQIPAVQLEADKPKLIFHTLGTVCPIVTVRVSNTKELFYINRTPLDENSIELTSACDMTVDLCICSTEKKPDTCGCRKPCGCN